MRRAVGPPHPSPPGASDPSSTTTSPRRKLWRAPRRRRPRVHRSFLSGRRALIWPGHLQAAAAPRRVSSALYARRLRPSPRVHCRSCRRSVRAPRRRRLFVFRGRPAVAGAWPVAASLCCTLHAAEAMLDAQAFVLRLLCQLLRGVVRQRCEGLHQCSFSAKRSAQAPLACRPWLASVLHAASDGVPRTYRVA